MSVTLGNPKNNQGLLRYFTPIQQPQQQQQRATTGSQPGTSENSRDILDFSPRRPVAVNPAVCKPFVSPVRSPCVRASASPAAGGTPPKRTRAGEEGGADTIVISDDSASGHAGGSSVCCDVTQENESEVARPKTLYRSSFLAHGRLTLPPRPLCSRASSLSSSSVVPSSLPSDGDDDGVVVSDVSDASLSSGGTDTASSGARLPPPTSFHAALQLASRSVPPAAPPPPAARPGPLLSRFFVTQPAVPYPATDSPHTPAVTKFM